jgi:hypothetical protein
VYQLARTDGGTVAECHINKNVERVYVDQRLIFEHGLYAYYWWKPDSASAAEER